MFAKVVSSLSLAAHLVGAVIWPVADRAGRLHTTSGPAVAHDPVDLASTDATWAAGEEPRGIWANGGGAVKVDGFKRDGTAVLGTVFTVDGAGLLPVGRVSKVYKTGTTVSSLIALW